MAIPHSTIRASLRNQERRKPRSIRFGIVAIAVGLIFSAFASSANGSTPVREQSNVSAAAAVDPDRGSNLPLGGYLRAGWYIGTAHYQFIMQADGNLVEYKYGTNGGKRACWNSGTFGRGYYANYASGTNGAWLYLRDSQANIVRSWQGYAPLGRSTVDVNSIGQLWVAWHDIFPQGC